MLTIGLPMEVFGLGNADDSSTGPQVTPLID